MVKLTWEYGKRSLGTVLQFIRQLHCYNQVSSSLLTFAGTFSGVSSSFCGNPLKDGDANNIVNSALIILLFTPPPHKIKQTHPAPRFGLPKNKSTGRIFAIHQIRSPRYSNWVRKTGGLYFNYIMERRIHIARVVVEPLSWINCGATWK